MGLHGLVMHHICFPLFLQDPAKKSGAANVFSSVIQKLEQQYVVSRKPRMQEPLPILSNSCYADFLTSCNVQAQEDDSDDDDDDMSNAENAADADMQTVGHR
jgi:hypothetical protein